MQAERVGLLQWPESWCYTVDVDLRGGAAPLLLVLSALAVSDLDGFP